MREKLIETDLHNNCANEEAQMHNTDFDMQPEENDTYFQCIPTYMKYTIGIREAARFYGIGEKKLRELILLYPQGDFFIEVGKKVLLKRPQFEAFLAGMSTI